MTVKVSSIGHMYDENSTIPRVITIQGLSSSYWNDTIKDYSPCKIILKFDLAQNPLEDKSFKLSVTDDDEINVIIDEIDVTFADFITKTQSYFEAYKLNSKDVYLATLRAYSYYGIYEYYRDMEILIGHVCNQAHESGNMPVAQEIVNEVFADTFLHRLFDRLETRVLSMTAEFNGIPTEEGRLLKLVQECIIPNAKLILDTE